MSLSISDITEIFKKYYAFTFGELEDALFGSVASSIKSLMDNLIGLATVRQTGYDGQLWTDFWRIFLSRREEKTDYKFSIKNIALYHQLFGELDSSKISNPVTILDYEKAVLAIHKARGTENGILADVKRMCNSTNVTVAFYGQDKCGWIGDITAPELTPGLSYDPDSSLCFMDLDNMVIVNAENNGSRANIDVEKIIRHDFVPVKYNLTAHVTKSSEVDYDYSTSTIGDIMFGGINIGG
jgi:hypothetical protein